MMIGQFLDTIEKHGTFLLVLANFLLWLTTLRAIREARRAAQGNLIAQLSRDFFFNDRLYKVRRAIERDKPILKANHGCCEDQDIDDYLGTFEMIDGLVDEKILDSDIAEDNFQEYAEDALKNKKVSTFIADLRRERNRNDIYKGFENFAKGLRAK